jgi:hypothetical protein
LVIKVSWVTRVFRGRSELQDTRVTKEMTGFRDFKETLVLLVFKAIRVIRGSTAG